MGAVPSTDYNAYDYYRPTYGYNNGFNSRYNGGYNNGYSNNWYGNGYTEYGSGYGNGYGNSYNNGYGNSYTNGYNNGYSNGYDIPETPSPNFVLVKDISSKSTETTVKEFFLFCGKIKEFELKRDEEDGEHQIALIQFERESAAKTAILLSNALVDDSHIIATSYFDIPLSDNEKSIEGDETQESKPKSRIAAEILANGYLLQDHVVAKGLEYDTKYNLSTRLSQLLTTFQTNGKSLK
ncbi:hypothetical protein G6F56_010265 [Rhizopus delemar]|nr:hypothetical protein G6F56_010265 [Rhizopus delemar]